MKKATCVLIAVLATTTAAFAVDTPVSQLTFSTNSNNEIVITGFASGISLTEINIPSTINTLPVTTIGNFAFDGSSITNATLPASLTTIELYAFGSSDIQTIEMPGVKTIEEAAFENCQSLTAVTLPVSLQTIGSTSFGYCGSLATLTVDPNNLNYKSINNVLFNKSGTELILYSIGQNATSYTVPSDVQTIGEGAFAGSSLVSITLPNSIQTIDSYSFMDCNDLESIILPNSIQTIGFYAFHNCSSLESITLPDSIQTIGESTFGNCESLASVTLPVNLQSIGPDAFYSCSSLESINLPDSLEALGYGVFSSCSNLLSITFLGDAPPAANVGLAIFDDVASSAKVYVLPDATGFGTLYHGLPVVVLELIDTISYENSNLLINLNSSNISNIVVEETADLTADNWITNHNPVIINGTFQFSTTNSHRYYRFSF